MALMDASEAGATQAQSPELQGVVSQLRAEFEAGPIEDGITHPAEQIVANHLPSLMQISPERLLAELEAEHGTDFCSSLLQCLGRCDLPSSLASPAIRRGASREPSVATSASHSSVASQGMLG